MPYIYIYFAAINLAAIILALHDKSAARRRKWRVKESTLLLVSAFGGSIAMLLTMRIIRHKTQHKKFMIGVPVIIVLQTIAAISVAALFYFGVLHFNNPSKTDFPVRGVDVSSYQGEIDWQTLSHQGIDFAYIKATEGSTFIDPYFEYNLTEALDTDLFVGAYHFFSFDSPAESQFENIIKVVQKNETLLPIAVDVEFYGSNHKNPPPKEGVMVELAILFEKLTEYYGKKPIIYALADSYDLYVSGRFMEYEIWYRDVISSPKISDGREFTFWQFSNRHRLDGYNGKEKYIDMNVFNGSFEKFETFAKGITS